MSENGQKTIELAGNVTVRDLATATSTSPIQVIKILMSNGVMANINQLVDFDTAAIVASELGFEATLEVEQEEKEDETGEIPFWRQIIANENPAKLVNRPPVVTILGHVDHGKTTLLDAIRHSEVAAGEAGGITQHIGAYQVEHQGKLITFLDTPGHAAFTAMRARGAQGADIVILVVAANDGIMPQTREAIAHARAARVPIIVALNKIDRPDANPDFVKKQLADLGLVPDEWDGNTMVVPVSAKQKTGIEDLLEAILLVSESMDIKANPASNKIIGTIIEAELDHGKGVMATLLVQNGSLEVGHIVMAGKAVGKLRAMFDFHGKKIRKAGPSTPVQIMGLSDVPEAGELFQVYDSEKEARAIAEERKAALQQKTINAPKASLESLFNRIQAGETKELRLIVKADVQGSLEPITTALTEIEKGDVNINVLYSETGDIGENDVNLASASKAIILGFNVQADAGARRLAEAEGVSIRLYQIIYRLTEDVEKALKGMLEPEFKEIPIGKAEVMAVFKITKLGNIAGCRVTQNEIRRNGKIRVMRGGEKVFEGEISSLKHEKDDVKEVRQGFDCGISLKNFETFEKGDVLECFTLERSS